MANYQHPCENCREDHESGERVIYCPLAGENLARQDCTWIYNLSIKHALGIFREFAKTEREIQSKGLRKCRCGDSFKPQYMAQSRCETCSRKHFNRTWNEMYQHIGLPVKRSHIRKGVIRK